MIDSSLLASAPLDTVDGIPCFSPADRYTENYAKIAGDHLARMQPGAANPWIPDTLWLELEDSTSAHISNYSRDGQRVLDVGVSLARLLERFPALDRHGIDISLDYLRIARGKGVEVCYARVEDMPYVDELFDMVIATDVLEHVLDLNRCTTQMLRVLKPGGHLVIRVPYREDLSPYLQPGLPYEFIHLRTFDEHSLRLHFEKIFRCEVLLTEPVAPYLQGAPRFRYRFFGRTDAIHEWLDREGPRLVDEDPDAYALMREMSRVAEEDVVTWIYQVRDGKPALYERIKRHLLLPIEINTVVRKPL